MNHVAALIASASVDATPSRTGLGPLSQMTTAVHPEVAEVSVRAPSGASVLRARAPATGTTIRVIPFTRDHR